MVSSNIICFTYFELKWNFPLIALPSQTLLPFTFWTLCLAYFFQNGWEFSVMSLCTNKTTSIKWSDSCCFTWNTKSLHKVESLYYLSASTSIKTTEQRFKPFPLYSCGNCQLHKGRSFKFSFFPGTVQWHGSWSYSSSATHRSSMVILWMVSV